MYRVYQVQTGETLDSIANRFNTTVQNLKTINGIQNDSVFLRPGSFLIVPMVDDRFTTYVVKKGDNLYAVAREYGVDYDLLLRLNGLEKTDIIYPNQEILIPNKNYKFYVTEEGDTLSSVANSVNLNPMDLVNQNETIYLEQDQLIIYK